MRISFKFEILETFQLFVLIASLVLSFREYSIQYHQVRLIYKPAYRRVAEMSLNLGPEQIQYFQHTGAICLRQVFEPHWLAKVAKGIETNLLNPSSYAEKLLNENSDTSISCRSSNEGGYYFNDYCNWRVIPEFRDYISNSPASSIAGQLMESEYAGIYHEHVLVKSAGSSRETPWHVDQSYYPIDGYKVCSIWMPIDPIGLESTIQFIEGSHLWPTWFKPRKFATTLNYDMIEEENSGSRSYVDVPSSEELLERSRIVQWDVKPGDCIVFHMKTLHGAPGNVSKVNERRILSTRWLGDDAVITSRPWEISPPTYGGLNIGDKAVSEEFPIIWRRNSK